MLFDIQSGTNLECNLVVGIECRRLVADAQGLVRVVVLLGAKPHHKARENWGEEALELAPDGIGLVAGKAVREVDQPAFVNRHFDVPGDGLGPSLWVMASAVVERPLEESKEYVTC